MLQNAESDVSTICVYWNFYYFPYMYTARFNVWKSSAYTWILRIILWDKQRVNHHPHFKDKEAEI